jgi:hypothetical protein
MSVEQENVTWIRVSIGVGKECVSVMPETNSNHGLDSWREHAVHPASATKRDMGTPKHLVKSSD